jgi:hypothetical protein
MFSKIVLDDNEKNEFTLVTKKTRNSSKMLSNPLFNTISALKKSKEISSLSIKHSCTATGDVYYISLLTPVNPLFNSDFKFEDSHLTVNEYYKKNKIGINNGLGTIHYTEVYNNPVTSEALVIHAYFTKQGLFQHTQAKIYPNGRIRENGKVVILSPTQLAQLRETVEQSSATVQFLVNKNQTFYNQALDSARQIEAQMKIIAATKKTRDDYYNQAQNYIDKIREINLFSYGAEDPRGEWMAQFIAKMKNMEEDFQTEKVEIATPIVVSEINQSPPNEREANPVTEALSIAKEDNTKKVSKKYLDIKMLVNNVADIQLKIKKNPSDVLLLIDCNELMNELNLQLLLVSSNLSNLTKKQRKDINRWINLDYTKPDLVAIFFDHFWKGDIDIIELLFPHVGHLIKINHITDLLIKLVDSQPKLHLQENLNKAFNFLYENSANYNFAFQIADILLSNAQTKISRSLLLIAFVNKNLFAYKILLEHGISPNALGFWYCDQKLANINAMVAYGHNDLVLLPYLQLAILHGANYCNVLASFNINTRKSSNEVHKILKASNPNLSALEELKTLSTQTIIERCCNYKLYQSLELFLPQMTLEHLLDAAGYITNRKAIVKRNLVPSIEHGCKVVDAQNLPKATLEVSDHSKKFKLYSVLISGENSEKETLEFLARLLELIKSKINFLSENSPEELKCLQEESLEDTKNINSQNKHSYKFDRCLFLFMLDPKPDSMKYQSLMQLYCRQARYSKQLFLYKLDETVLSIARCLAEDSVFSKFLVKTKLYAYILEQLGESHVLGPNKENKMGGF